jgi:hypothetical protein
MFKYFGLFFCVIQILIRKPLLPDYILILNCSVLFFLQNFSYRNLDLQW